MRRYGVSPHGLTLTAVNNSGSTIALNITHYHLTLVHSIMYEQPGKIYAVLPFGRSGTSMMHRNVTIKKGVRARPLTPPLAS